MDVLVKWRNGKQNVVSSKDLELVNTNSVLSSGASVKMYWPPKNKFFYGTVITTEKEQNLSFDSEDDIPLINLINQSKSLNITPTNLDKPLESVGLVSASNTESISEAFADVVILPVVPDQDLENHSLNANNVEETDLPANEVFTEAIPTPIVLPEENKLSSYTRILNRTNDFMDNRDEGPSVQSCEFINCNGEVFAACVRCQVLLCWSHFDNDDNCNGHGAINISLEDINSDFNIESVEKAIINRNVSDNLDVLSRFAVDGEKREVHVEKKIKKNKKKVARALRTEGKAYVSSVTKKSMPAKCMKPRCEKTKCKATECDNLDEEQRQRIYNAFYNTKSLQLQREFLVRHVKSEDIRRKRTTAQISRRTRTLKYTLPNGGSTIHVCRIMFLNTLGISEKTLRTAMSKLTAEGIVESDKRGGRYKNLEEKDKQLRDSIVDHIHKFPRMESHFCRKSTSREYLHPDLTRKRMYDLYIEENAENGKMCSYQTYRRIFRSLNLSFHHPKKDQCTLCMSYRKGDAEKKKELENSFCTHTAEKNAVRKIKEKCKEVSKCYPNIVTSAVFDLQQVIQLPISNESAIFYRRRLSVFNFTIYNIGDKDCRCFLWDETISKRGANEISTCVSRYLCELDDRGLREVNLFSDGCGGQNRNTIVFTMLLHTITKAKSLRKIHLYFFESSHGQNEGDSAHSSISTAMSLAGDIFIPAQLPPILKLARRHLPYTVINMNVNNFYDFKSLSEKIRIKSVRKFETGEDVDWTKVKEVMVDKDNVAQLFVKNSHLANNYFILPLKRNTLEVMTQPIPLLNKDLKKLSRDKYNDLVSLCSGLTPVVKDSIFQKYFKDLPHE